MTEHSQPEPPVLYCIPAAEVTGVPAKYERAFEYARCHLQQDLLPAFQYHNASHTLNEVAPICEWLAQMEGIPDHSRWLLLTGAYFHDVGLTVIKSLNPNTYRILRAEHEDRAVEMACSILPGCGFDAQELDEVCRLILATRWGYVPQNRLEEMIHDADMSSIGGNVPYYMQTSFALRRELIAFGAEISEVAWLESQARLLESHPFYTASGRSLFEENKHQNVVAIKARIAAIQTAGKDVY